MPPKKASKSKDPEEEVKSGSEEADTTKGRNIRKIIGTKSEPKHVEKDEKKSAKRKEPTQEKGSGKKIKPNEETKVAIKSTGDAKILRVAYSKN